MANFSKGNWQINKHLDITCNGRYVALVCYTNPITPLDNQSTARSNARLIAAAPDMYELLKKTLDDTQNGQFAREDLLEELLARIDGKDE